MVAPRDAKADVYHMYQVRHCDFLDNLYGISYTKLYLKYKQLYLAHVSSKYLFTHLLKFGIQNKEYWLDFLYCSNEQEKTTLCVLSLFEIISDKILWTSGNLLHSVGLT